MADTDLRVGGGGGLGAVSKVFFWPFRLQFGPGIRGWEGGGSPGSPSVSSLYMGVPRDLNLRPPALSTDALAIELLETLEINCISRGYDKGAASRSQTTTH